MKPHSLLESSPPLGRLTCRLDPLPWGFVPFNDIAQASPVEAVYHCRLGSALRLSQPLSGFLASPSFAALFHAATVPGVLPSESSPRRNRAPLSRPHCSLAVIHQRAETPPPRPCHCQFHRLPTLSRSCLAPRGSYGLPFRTPKRASRLPWVRTTERVSFRQLHPLRSLDPPASPFVSTRVAPSQHAAPLLAFCLSRAFSSHASSSRTRVDPRIHTCTLARRLRHTAQRTRHPSHRVRPLQHEMHRNGLVDRLQPAKDWTTPPLGDASSPSALRLRTEARSP
jgi:hypothetical protein